MTTPDPKIVAMVRELEQQARHGDLLDRTLWTQVDRWARDAWVASGPLAPKWSDRIAALRRQAAMQGRRVPDGVLDDLVASIQSQVAAESEDPARYWRRAGLSSSFLDAPRQLAVWRRMAVAALLLVGLGAGALATGSLRVGSDSVASPATAAEAVDPRRTLLQRDSVLPRRYAPDARSRRGTRSMFPASVNLVGTGGRALPNARVDTTVVFPMRDLGSRNVSDLLDGLAIPEIGSQPVEHN